MSTPIIESIAANIETAIGEITIANEFNQTLTAVRPRRVDFRKSAWNDLTALINQVESEAVDIGSMAKGWRQYFLIVVIVVDSDDSETTIDTRLNQIAADIEKKLMEDETRGGYAIDTDVTEQSRFGPDDEGPGGVAVKFAVEYRTQSADPYTGM